MPAPGHSSTQQIQPPASKRSFLSGGLDWRDLDQDIPSDATPQIADEIRRKVQSDQKAVAEYLQRVLTSPNLIVLVGSGASLGKANGPSMGDLWEKTSQLPDFQDVLDIVRQPANDMWIESLLSRCSIASTFLEEEKAQKVAKFLSKAESLIWNSCSEFLSRADLESHKTFLRRMARRRLRAPRLKLFTTNYDLCFETAAGELGITIIDGFSFAQPRHFDPRYFSYDIVRRATHTDDTHDFVEGVIHILKLHGSVDWDLTDKGIVQRLKPEKPCLIYPTVTKYEHSFSQPHLELMSQFQTALREPNTCLVTVGFGFNDNHLSAPIIAAIENNPSLKFLAVDPAAHSKSTASGVYGQLRRKINAGEADIALLNADFSQFSEMIPQLKALSPAEQIEKSISRIAHSS